MKNRHHGFIVFFLFLFILLEGCSTVGVALYYKKAKLPEAQIVRNVPYTKSADADPVKNSLNLFLPKGKNWPTMVFVHGGMWIEGDKDLKVSGADVYGNIGRYFASQGIGVAVISYRLLPSVDWKKQLLDVARATGWVYRHIHEYKGDPKAIFLAGHSSGAQLASRVAMDLSFMSSMGLPQVMCGVIPISGAGYNFLNEETYQLGLEEGVYKELFNQETISKPFRKKISPVFYARKSSPPFLILYAGREEKELQQESLKFYNALVKAGTPSQIYSIPKERHKKMVLTLSHANKMPAKLMMVFMRTLDCTSYRPDL
ncbi:MAG: alpha/beta hydrolase [Deltaproteobacteria bacterium]|nr:alpha/beta hydrolase [Deltaproteobacteria bacterium]